MSKTINSLHISHEQARKQFMTDKDLLIWQKKEIEKLEKYCRQLEREIYDLKKLKNK